MNITPTTAFTKIAVLTKPIRLVCGGSSASKTYSILQQLIILASSGEHDIAVIAATVPALKEGAYKDFLSILKTAGVYDSKNHNKTDMVYTIGKSRIKFLGCEDSDKIRGKRQTIAFFNEVNNIPFDVFEEIQIRTKYFVIADYNPVAPFWANEQLIGRDDVDFITVTYKDNEFLDKKIIEGIESYKTLSETHPNEAARKYYLNRWKVMGLGQMGISDGLCVTNWSEIDELPAGAELLGSGLDYGFTNDPTSLISVYRYDNELIVDEKIYNKGLLNSKIAEIVKQSDARTSIIYADSAEPKSNAELKAQGLPVLPVYKGKDSVNYGISLMNEKGFKVTSRSVNLIKELENYKWAKDREGNALNVPEDAWNHGVDALRYFFLMKFGNNSGTFSLKVRPYRG